MKTSCRTELNHLNRYDLLSLFQKLVGYLLQSLSFAPLSLSLSWTVNKDSLLILGPSLSSKSRLYSFSLLIRETEGGQMGWLGFAPLAMVRVASLLSSFSSQKKKGETQLLILLHLFIKEL